MSTPLARPAGPTVSDLKRPQGLGAPSAPGAPLHAVAASGQEPTAPARPPRAAASAGLGLDPAGTLLAVVLLLSPALAALRVGWALAAGLALLACAILWWMFRQQGRLQASRHKAAQADARAAELALQVQAAAQARAAAEEASHAKTRFLAAASHDLRQPLHAIGLLTEALRDRSQDPELRLLVDSLGQSVDALEGLFGELLDLTRIDAGGMEVQPEAVRMGDIYARLRLHFEPIAFEKGLALGFRGRRHVVHADPLLLERVLRNLLGNAIRYSDDGGVLVSCRLRSAGGHPHLLLQVWDTGVGIAPEHLPRIFDEFFQARGPGAASAAAAGPARGLGLGLAIVRRLAGLMQTPLSVRSRPGHGTVFSLILPPGRMPRAAETGAGTARPRLALTLAGRRIVVVESPSDVPGGLQSLLRTWEAETVALESLQAVRQWVAGTAGTPPDLLVVDDQLPLGHTGIEALQVLRARWPQARLPGIIIAASQGEAQAREAAALDAHLLVKPVMPNRLRAMIAFKLGVRP